MIRMSGVPAEIGETSNSRRINETSHPDAVVDLSAEEELEAEETFSTYCKPLEFYNTLRQREIDKPFILHKSLDYRIQAKRKRLQMTVLLSWSTFDETQSLLPMYFYLARQLPNDRDTEHTTLYQLGRFIIIRDSYGPQIQARFKLPEVKKLDEEARSGSLYILFFTPDRNPHSSFDEARAGQPCLSGRASLEALYMAWNSSPSFIRGRAEMMSRVDLLPCILECLGEGLAYIFQPPCNPEDENKYWKKLQLSVTAEEYGAREITPMYAYESSDVAAPELSRLIQLRNGNVVFNYRYYNDTLYRKEVTEDFSCPFCLVGCGSYKGLRFHLLAFHDHYFNFEFLAPHDQAVNVSVKTDILKSKTVTVDPKSQTFFFCAKPLRRKIPENFLTCEDSDGDQSDSEFESFREDGDAELMEVDGDSTPTIQSHHDLDPAPLLISEPDPETPRVQQVSRTGKIRVEPDNATTEVLKQVAKEGKLPVEPDHGTPAEQQVAEEGNLPVELDHETPRSQQVAKKGNFPTECDHATTTVQQVSKKTSLPAEPDHGTSRVQRVAKKGRLPAVEPDHEMTPAVQQPSENGKLPAVEPDHEMLPAVQQLPVEPDHGTPAVRKVAKKGKLSVEPGHETPTVQRAAKKGRLSVELGGETSVQQAARVEPSGEIPTVQQVAKKGRLSVEPSGEAPTVQQAAKKGRLTIEANHKTPAVKQAAKKGKLQVEFDLGTTTVQQVDKKGKSTVEPDHGTPTTAQQAAKKGKSPAVPDHGTPTTAQQAAKKGKSPAVPDHGSPAVQQGSNKRKGKLPVKHVDPQSTYLLSKRQFIHSRTYQPMSLEEVLSGYDSETEVDNETRDIEDRTLIDKFDLTKDEKDILFMWNTFIRRQHVMIDGHITWACKAFAKQHAPLLVQSPQLAFNWRMFMIKLWNHKLLRAETINACNIIIEEYQKQNPDPGQS